MISAFFAKVRSLITASVKPGGYLSGLSIQRLPGVLSPLRHPTSLLLVMAIANPASAAERTPIVVYGLVGCADLASTEYAIHNGAREANPLGQGSLTRLRRKAALGAGLYLIDRELAKTPGGKKWAWALRGVAVVGWGFVAVHNVRVARSGR